MSLKRITALAVILEYSDRGISTIGSRGAFVFLSPLQLITEIYRAGALFRGGHILLIIKGQIPIEVAHDVARALRVYADRAGSNKITGFSEHLDLATALILSACYIRLSTPFTGPIFFGYSMPTINISGLLSHIGSETSLQRCGVLKKGPEVLEVETSVNDGGDENALTAQIRDLAVKQITEWVPSFKADRLWYASGRALQDAGFLTATSYYEDLWRWHSPRRLPNFVERQKQKLARGYEMFGNNQTWIIELQNPKTDWFDKLVENQAICFFTRRLKSLPKAIVLIVRHNGGDFGPADRLFTLLEMLGGRVPIYTHVWRGLSSGYLLCCASQKINIAPLGRIGSVGTYSAQIDLAKTFEKMGIQFKSIPEESCRTYGSFGFELSQSYKDAAKERVAAAYGRYIDVLQRRRSMDAESLGFVKEGRVFLGSEGVACGLADSAEGMIDYMETINRDLGGAFESGLAVLSVRSTRTNILFATVAKLLGVRS